MTDTSEAGISTNTWIPPEQAKLEKQKLKYVNEHFVSVFFLLMMLLFPQKLLQKWIFASFAIINSLMLLDERKKSWKIAVFLEFMTFPVAVGGSSTLSLIPPFLILPSFLLTMCFTRSLKLVVISVFIQVAITHILIVPIECMALRNKFGRDMELIYKEAVKTNTLLSVVIIGIMLYLEWRVNQHLESTEKLKEELSSANNKLKTKKNELERNLETEELFLLTFSHELKNSLNGLLGNLSLALECVVDPEVFGYLKQAKICGHILRNFILNILESGKIEKSSLQVVYERTDSSEWFSKLWAITCEIIRNKRLKGFMKVSRNMPRFLQIDQQRLFQIILNLASNAVKFTKEGYVYLIVDWEDGQENEPQSARTTTEKADLDSNKELGDRTPSFLKPQNSDFSDLASVPSLSIPELGSDEKEGSFILKVPASLTKRTLKNCYWILDFNNRSLDSDTLVTHNESTTGVLKISVIDTGCGMNTEQISKLFRKFSQVGTESEKKFGTGLGLWISKELAEKMNGTIQVKSRPGIGSIFEVRIQTTVLQDYPLINHISSFLPSKAINLRSYLLGEESKKTISLTSCEDRKKVLIADDDAFNIDLMINYLRKLKYEYIVAYNGEELVKAVQEHYSKISVILTDNHMPKMNGIDAIKEIRSYLLLEMKPMLPAYLLTGDHKISEDVNFKSLGIEKLLSKPIEFQSFKEIIQTHMEN